MAVASPSPVILADPVLAAAPIAAPIRTVARKRLTLLSALIDVLPMLSPAAERCGARPSHGSDGPFITLRPCHLPVGHQFDRATRAHAHTAVAKVAPETPHTLRLRAEWNARLDAATDHRNGCGACDWLGPRTCDEGLRLDDAERSAFGAYYTARYADPVVLDEVRR